MSVILQCRNYAKSTSGLLKICDGNVFQGVVIKTKCDEKSISMPCINYKLVSLLLFIHKFTLRYKLVVK